MQAAMDLARTVQRGLLPHQPPVVAGLDLFARSQPALQVGGDFFDFVSAPDRPLIMTLGDRSAGAIAEALFAAVSSFSAGREQSDDQTLVVIKRGPTI